MNMIGVEAARPQPHRPGPLEAPAAGVSRQQRMRALAEPRHMLSDRRGDGGREGLQRRSLALQDVGDLAAMAHRLVEGVGVVHVDVVQRLGEVAEIGVKRRPARRRDQPVGPHEALVVVEFAIARVAL